MNHFVSITPIRRTPNGANDYDENEADMAGYHAFDVWRVHVSLLGLHCGVECRGRVGNPGCTRVRAPGRVYDETLAHAGLTEETDCVG